MRNAVLALLVCLCLGACSSVPLSLPSKQPDPEEAADSRRPSKPRDARTRAKLHTELGALYLQANQLATALEELTIAIDIDPSYAKAVHTKLKKSSASWRNYLVGKSVNYPGRKLIRKIGMLPIN